MGLLLPLELAVYDYNLRTANQAPEKDPRILIVLINEQDGRDYGFPIEDVWLARVLRKLEAAGPRTIGLDIYRDVRVGPGGRQLDRVFRENERLIAVAYTEMDEQVPGPPALEGTDRVGVNTLPLDPDKEVRRALLYESYTDGGSAESFALRIARAYLEEEGEEGIYPEPDPEVADWLRLGQATLPPFEADDGAYVAADAAGYQMLIDCHQGSAGFETTTVSAVLDKPIAPSRLQDRVVLIGQNSESVRDHQRIPCSADLTPGVTIHAHIVSQLLRLALGESRLLRTMPEWQEVGLIALVIGLGCGLALALRRAQFYVLGLLAGLIVLWLLGAAAFRNQLWVPIVAPGFGYVAAMGIVLAWTTSQERAQRALLMQLFRSYTSPEVADQIWRERDELLSGGRMRAQRLVATVLFVDMKGYTAQAEKMEPEELMDWVNEFMEPMARKVGEFHGVVDDYFGDGLKSNFGVPFPRKNEAEISEDARRAVRCALEMEQVLHRLNTEHRARGLPTIAMRLGIHTGPVVAGALGSENYFKYTTVGDVAVTAQRLESFDEVEHDFVSQPVRILISGETRSRLDESFDVHPLGDFSLRGKDAAIAIWRVLGPTSS
jgi:adenylate cyclase